MGVKVAQPADVIWKCRYYRDIYSSGEYNVKFPQDNHTNDH